MKTARMSPIPATIAAATIAAATLALISANAASASEKQGMDRAACAVKAGPDGTSPATLSDAELRARLEAAGYTKIRSLGGEHGCVEAKGTDKDGKRFEVYLHPATGEIITQR